MNEGAVPTDIIRPDQTALAAHLAHSQFYQMVHLIGLIHTDLNQMGPGHDPAHEPVLFRATRSLSFGAADVSSISYDPSVDRFNVRVNFFGLYGPASPLPPYVTERIIESDETPSSVEDLLDLFNHRLITLLFQIWYKSRYHVRYQAHGLDPTSKCFLALCGFPIEDRENIGSVARSALLPHVGLMSLYSNSAEAVSSVLSSFFKVPFRISEYVSRCVQVGEDAKIALGVRNTSLCQDIVLGDEVVEDLGKFRVRIGPAPYDDLVPFLPGGPRHQEIGELLSMVIRDPLDWDLEFMFEQDTIEAGRLGSARLGTCLWFKSEDVHDQETPVQLPAVTGLADFTDRSGTGQDNSGSAEARVFLPRFDLDGPKFEAVVDEVLVT